MRVLRRHLLPLLLVATAVAPATASAADCPGAGDRPSSGADLRAATICLMNNERTSRGLAPLQSNDRLEAAALGWSVRMVGEGFFAHETADSTLTARVTATGYLPASRWRVGENLAWGEMSHGTPSDIVAQWMASEGHRANMLDPNFRDVGIGIVVGRPGAPAGDSATYTADFGAITAAAPKPAADDQADAADVSVAKAARPAATKKKAAKKTRRATPRRGRSAQDARDARRRRALRKSLKMAAFASHQRNAAAAAAALHR